MTDALARSETLSELAQAHPGCDAVLRPLALEPTLSSLTGSSSNVDLIGSASQSVASAAGTEEEQQPAWVAYNTDEKKARLAQKLAAAHARELARRRTESVPSALIDAVLQRVACQPLNAAVCAACARTLAQLSVDLEGITVTVINDCGDQNVPWLTATLQKSALTVENWSSQVRLHARVGFGPGSKVARFARLGRLGPANVPIEPCVCVCVF